MKERGILFSAPMVRAIGRDEKTQTRRIVKARHVDNIHAWNLHRMQDGYADGRPRAVFEDGDEPVGIPCPYGTAGDRLYVKETHAAGFYTTNDPPLDTAYRADSIDLRLDEQPDPARWTPAIHMPRALARHVLDVTEVRVERLQDITEEDAKAEGVEFSSALGLSAVGSFMDLWDQINGKRASWRSNPWVWALTFQRVRP